MRLLLILLVMCGCGDERVPVTPTTSEITVATDDMKGWKIVSTNASGNWRIISGPRNCLILDDRTAWKPEAESSGMWIVMCPGIWSRDDVQSVIYAMRVAETLNEKLHLGIRPFNRYEDVWRWYGDENMGKTRSPVWVGFRNGKKIHHSTGSISAEEVQQLMLQFAEAKAGDAD